MKCSNPSCTRGIGLVSHQRGWFSEQRYCSRNCRDAFLADLTKQSRQELRAMTYSGFSCNRLKTHSGSRCQHAFG
jgi:hypothetical protein